MMLVWRVNSRSEFIASGTLPDFVYVCEQHYGVLPFHTGFLLLKKKEGSMEYNAAPIHLLGGLDGATLPRMSTLCDIRMILKRMKSVKQYMPYLYGQTILNIYN